MMLGLRDVLRRRHSAQVIDPATGRPTAQEPEVATIRASVQPAGPDDMETLPEGERTREGIRLYTTAPLRCADEHAGTPADEVSPDGGETWWEVRRLEHHRALMAHRKAIALRTQSLTVVPQPPSPLPGDWYRMDLGDAIYEFDDGFDDTYSQDEDGWITVSLERSRNFDRGLPWDAQAPHTWLLPMRDGRGQVIPFYQGAYRADLYIEVDPATAPPGSERVLVWLGIVDSADQPNAAGQDRYIGVEKLDGASVVYAVHQANVGAQGVPYYAHVWGTVDSLFPTIRAVPIDPATGAFGPAIQRGTGALGAASYWSIRVGTYTVGQTPTTPIRFRAWGRIVASDTQLPGGS